MATSDESMYIIIVQLLPISLDVSSNLNNKINSMHKKVLRIVYSDCKSTFQELLDKGASFSAHHKNTQT